MLLGALIALINTDPRWEIHKNLPTVAREPFQNLSRQNILHCQLISFVLSLPSMGRDTFWQHLPSFSDIFPVRVWGSLETQSIYSSGLGLVILQVEFGHDTHEQNVCTFSFCKAIHGKLSDGKLSGHWWLVTHLSTPSANRNRKMEADGINRNPS